MKTLLLAASVSLVVSVACAQEEEPAEAKRPDSVSEPAAATDAFLGIAMESEGKEVKVLSVVPGSPADKAGVEAGSIIVGIDGKTVEDDREVVLDAIKAKKPGDEVELQWGVENGVKAARIQLGSRLAANIQADAERLQKRSDADEATLRKDAEKMLRKLSSEDFRFVPPPEPKPFNPAERQLKRLAPEVKTDPFKKTEKAELQNWQPAPPLVAPPEFPHAGARPGNIIGPDGRKLEAPAQDVELDPYKEGQKAKTEPERRDFELRSEPVRDLEKGYAVPEKPHMTDPGEWETRKQAAKTEKNAGFDENNVWERVQKQVAGALEKSDLDPEVRKRVMQAVEEARHSQLEGQRASLQAAQLKLAKQLKLEAEIKALETRAQETIEQVRRLRQELETLRK
jgi:hypothetical protein